MGQVLSSIWRWVSSKTRRGRSSKGINGGSKDNQDTNNPAHLITPLKLNENDSDSDSAVVFLGIDSVDQEDDHGDIKPTETSDCKVLQVVTGEIPYKRKEYSSIIVENSSNHHSKVGESSIPRLNLRRNIGQYNSDQKILLVGEGDFSFSACLAMAFGSASNIIATSLNSLEFVIQNYGNFSTNRTELKNRGSILMHDIDATRMANHPYLTGMRFDRIIFNFPHAGFRNESPESQIKRHQKLVRSFLKNAKKMIEEDGQIHVTHKSNAFFLKWDIPKIGYDQGLSLIQEVKFKRSKYPGYHTKYGFGGDKDFDCNPSKTYKFAFTSKSS